MKLRGLRALLDGERGGVSGSRQEGAKMTSQSIATNSSETGATTLMKLPNYFLYYYYYLRLKYQENGLLVLRVSDAPLGGSTRFGV